MVVLLALISIFGYAITLNAYFKIKPSVSIFFSISFIITTLFFFGMLESLKVGSHALYFLGIMLFLFSIFKNLHVVKKWLFSVPVVMFITISIIYFFLMRDSQFFFWDEFSHWGYLAKQMFYSNSLYGAQLAGGSLRYPPGMQIWGYFFTSNSYFSEGNIYFAYFLILFSSTLMMYENLRFQNIYWIIIIFFLQMVIFASFGHWFSSAYVDHVVGAVFAGLVLSYLCQKFENKELFLFCFPLLMLVLAKEIGLYFGLSFLGLVLILRIVDLNKNIAAKKQKNLREYFKLFGIIFVLFSISVFVLNLWGVRQDSLGVPKSGQAMSEVIHNIFSNQTIVDETTKQEIKKRFWEVVVRQQVHKEKISLNYNEFSYGIMSKYNKTIKLSTFGVILFFILMFCFAYYSSISKEIRIKISLIYGYMLFVSISYLVIVYFSFLVAFGDGALRIPSFVRYVNMAILPMLMVGFSLFMPYFIEVKTIKNTSNSLMTPFVALATLLVILTIIIRPYFPPLYSQLENKFKIDVDKYSQIFLKDISNQKKLFMVFNVKNNGSLNNVLLYSFLPAQTTISGHDFENKSFAEMQESYRGHDYVLFTSLTKNIINKNRKVLKSKQDKNAYVLYKVEEKNNELEFLPVR